MPELKVWHISGGIMWNNKCDQIISIERPDFYSDRTSGYTKVTTHKVKRRRTGGALGDCDFDFLIGCSRYQERITQKIVCDPKRMIQIAYHFKKNTL